MAAVARMPMPSPHVSSHLSCFAVAEQKNAKPSQEYTYVNHALNFQNRKWSIIPSGWPISITSSTCWTGSDLQAEEYLHILTENEKIEIRAALVHFKGSEPHLSYRIPELIYH